MSWIPQGAGWITQETQLPDHIPGSSPASGLHTRPYPPMKGLGSEGDVETRLAGNAGSGQGPTV